MDKQGLRLETRIDEDCVYLDVSHKGSYTGFILYDLKTDKTVISNGLKEFLKNGINA